MSRRFTKNNTIFRVGTAVVDFLDTDIRIDRDVFDKVFEAFMITHEPNDLHNIDDDWYEITGFAMEHLPFYTILAEYLVGGLIDVDPKADADWKRYCARLNVNYYQCDKHYHLKAIVEDAVHFNTVHEDFILHRCTNDELASLYHKGLITLAQYDKFSTIKIYG